MNVQWQKCQGDVYCSLARLNLSSIVETSGVYIIWHAGNPGRVVRVGQGVIAERLAAHRNDTQIMQFASRGDIFVTWAAVPDRQLDGVERHLAEEWNPLVGSRFPDVAPIAVNSPFAA
jgi:hypothetical protein